MIRGARTFGSLLLSVPLLIVAAGKCLPGQDLGTPSHNLKEQASWLEQQAQIDRAGTLPDRLGTEEERPHLSFAELTKTYARRAAAHWKAGERQEAIADLRAALELAGLQPASPLDAQPGHEADFAGISSPYETMLSWAAELGDVSEAFHTMELSRARALVRQVQCSGIDLLTGLPADETRAIRQQENALRQRAASLERRIALVRDLSGLSAPQKNVQRLELQKQWGQTQADLQDAYRTMLSASRIHRLTTNQAGEPISLASAQSWTVQTHSLLLEYYVGDAGSFVIVVPPSGRPPCLGRLVLSTEDARLVNMEPGPLTARRLHELLVSRGPRLLSRLASPDRNDRATRQLALLWRILIPEPAHRAILEGKLKHLVIVPDGTLALLPFDALVIEDGKDPRYLLDVAPPMVYGCSATTLSNLAERLPATASPGQGFVLALGDPEYPDADIEPRIRGANVASARDRYRAAGGPLARLPYTGWEAQWLAKHFNDCGIKANLLLGPNATEAALRAGAPGCRVLHLGCHGIAEQTRGNPFGALALTPGPRAALDPSDDGFLTLPEISELDLRRCELVLLSASQAGDEPLPGEESVWTLSQTFLLAGARRVLASDWLVDDEAAASVIDHLSVELADVEPKHPTLDYASALQNAKRAVRKDRRTQEPYFWGALRLVGPW